jgi:non-heme chloroperoxidase
MITRRRHTVTVSDGTEIFFKDWGTGQPIVFSHGWPLSADAWEDQMVFLGQHGYRCIAHYRQGQGRSSLPWTGNDASVTSPSGLTVEKFVARI